MGAFGNYHFSERGEHDDDLNYDTYSNDEDSSADYDTFDNHSNDSEGTERSLDSDSDKLSIPEILNASSSERQKQPQIDPASSKDSESDDESVEQTATRRSCRNRAEPNCLGDFCRTTGLEKLRPIEPYRRNKSTGNRLLLALIVISGNEQEKPSLNLSKITTHG